MRTGLNSDKRIRENYLNAYLPIPVGKLHSVMQRPATSFYAPSRPRRDYNAPSPMIPQYIAEQVSKKEGPNRSSQISAINGDFLRRASNAKNSYSVLRPVEMREGALQQNIGKTRLQSMGEAVSTKTNRVDNDFISKLVDRQAVYGPGYSNATPAMRMALKSKRGQENLQPSAQALKGEIAEYLDPMISTEMTMVSLLSHKNNNPMILTRNLKERPQVKDIEQPDPQTLFPPEDEELNEPIKPQKSAQALGGTSQTLGGQPLTVYTADNSNSVIEYSKDPKTINPTSVPRKGNKDDMLAFLIANVQLAGMPAKKSRNTLSKFSKKDMSNLITKYFPRTK